MKNLSELMKQAQKMQESMQQAQESLAKLEVVGEAGGGMVKVNMNGRHQVKRVQIDENLLQDDRDMLEDMVAAAFNDAVAKLQEASQEKLSSVTAGINLPPGFKLPF